MFNGVIPTLDQVRQGATGLPELARAKELGAMKTAGGGGSGGGGGGWGDSNGGGTNPLWGTGALIAGSGPRQAAAPPPGSPMPTGQATAPVGPTAAQIDPFLKALEATDPVRANALSTAQDRYNTNTAGYAEENALDRANYDKQVSQNEQNLTTNRMASLLQAAVGGRGLRSVLASLNALSGTGSILADRAIAGEANKDIGEADKSFETNADTLTTAWGDTERKQRQRDADAKAAFENDKRAAEKEYASTRQNIFTQLANLFGPNHAKGIEYSGQAASLYPTIAANTAETVAPYQARSPLYSAQAMDAYKGGAADLSVSTKGAGGQSASATNSPLMAFNRRRDEELA